MCVSQVLVVSHHIIPFSPYLPLTSQLVLREVEGPVINQVMVLEPYAVRLAAKAAKAANVHSNATAA